MAHGLPAQVADPANGQRVRRQSLERYGRSRDQVELEIRKWSGFAPGSNRPAYRLAPKQLEARVAAELGTGTQEELPF